MEQPGSFDLTDTLESLWQEREKNFARVWEALNKLDTSSLDELSQAKVNLIKAYLYFREIKITETIGALKSNHCIFKNHGNSLWLGRQVGVISLLAGESCHHDLSMQALQIQEAIAQQINDPEMLFTVYHDYGVEYLAKDEPYKALEFFQKSESYVKTARDKGFLLINLGRCYMHMKKYEAAKQYFQDALVLAQNNSIGYILELSIRAFIQLSIKEKNYDHAMRLIEDLEKKQHLQGLTYYYKSSLYLNQNNLDLAEHYALETLRLSSTEKTPSLVSSSHGLLRQIYQTQGNKQLALKHQDLSEDCKKSSMPNNTYAKLNDFLTSSAVQLSHLANSYKISANPTVL